MTAAPLRAKQTTTTTGTGNLTLIAAESNVRSFQAAAGVSAVPVCFCIAFATGFEMQINTFDGGSPGTLTRTSGGVIASSNGGSLVSLPAGTSDVFLINLPGLRGIRTGTTSETATVLWWGEQYIFTGSGNQTITLPSATTVPPGPSLLVLNQGTALLTLDGNASETINGATTLVLYPGQWAEVFRRGSGFDAIGNFGPPPIYKTGTGTMTAGVLAVSFATAFPNGILDASAEQSGASGVGTFNGVALSSLTTSGFTAYSVVGYGGAIRWRAWGY